MTSEQIRKRVEEQDAEIKKFLNGSQQTENDIQKLNGQLDELEEKLKKIAWPIDYGSVKIQIRTRKPTLITIEQTIKLD